jgi:hypothetical protein
MIVRFLMLGVIPFMITQPALAAPASLSCTATGTKLLSPPAPAAAVCARMKAGLEKAMARKMGDAVPAKATLAIDIRLTKPATATAYLVEHRGGRNIAHPPISVDVMDRALDLKIVDILASEVAKHLSKR